ncbi:MAG: hypothetical protein Q9159_002032 [Coniocarpon cinnabarinum]
MLVTLVAQNYQLPRPRRVPRVQENFPQPPPARRAATDRLRYGSRFLATGIREVMETDRNHSRAHLSRRCKKQWAATMRKAPEDVCVVCRDDLAAGQYLIKLDCAHVYHAECLADWIERVSRCAICLRDITRTQQLDIWRLEGK